MVTSTVIDLVTNEDGQVEIRAAVESDGGPPVLQKKVMTRMASRAMALDILRRQGAEGMGAAKAFVDGTLVFEPSPSAPFPKKEST